MRGDFIGMIGFPRPCFGQSHAGQQQLGWAAAGDPLLGAFGHTPPDAKGRRVGGDPLPQARPSADQRLMRDVDDVAAGIASAGRQQPRSVSSWITVSTSWAAGPAGMISSSRARRRVSSVPSPGASGEAGLAAPPSAGWR